AIGREEDHSCRQGRGIHHVVAGKEVEDKAVVGGLGAADVHLGGQAEHRRAADGAVHQDDVVAVGAVDDHGIRLGIADAVGRREVDVDLGHVGAGQVVHHDRVRTAEGVEVDTLDVVQVHHHGGDV